MGKSSAARVHPMEALHSRLALSLGSSGLSSYLAYELSVYYYGLFSWGKRSFEQSNMKMFTLHKESGWLTMVFFIIKLLILEGLIIHFFVAQWSSIFAWVLSVGNIYMILWLISDYRALKLNPLGVSSQGIWIRYGNQMRTFLHYDQIVSIETVNNKEFTTEEEKHIFKPIGPAPNVHIQLKEAVKVNVMMGFSKSVTDVYVTLDHPKLFIEECAVAQQPVDAVAQS